MNKLLNQMYLIGKNKNSLFYSEQDAKDIENLLTGATLKLNEKTERYAEWTLVKDGKTYDVQLEGNEGCDCANGNTYFDNIGECENIITRAEVITKETRDEYGEYAGKYEIYVYSDNQKINLLQGECVDNGYYGMGYTLIVSDIKERKEN